MGIDAGFDMVPPLSNEAIDRENWQSFIKIIKERYQNDNLVEVKPKYIVFKAGEHPLLPFDDHNSCASAQGFQSRPLEALSLHWYMDVSRTEANLGR
jgi:hypothetical protein